MKRTRGLKSWIKKFITEMTPAEFAKWLLALTGLNIKAIVEAIFPSVQVPILVGVLLSVAVLLFIVIVPNGKRDYKKKHIFEECSIEEAVFFDEWYRKEGRIFMFCTDLEWLENEIYLRVVDALKKKGNKLNLYLKKTDHRIVNELKLAGANLYYVRQNIRSEHRFSIRKNNGFHSIIIRNKELESGQIQIEEYPNNPALVNLALDMLDDCLDNRDH